MIAVCCGALGAVLVLAVFVLGAAAGWKARDMLRARGVAPEVNGEEHRRIQEEQRAFEDMLHYSIDTAYGRDAGLSHLMGGEEQ